MPQLAAELLERMRAAGVEPRDEQAQLPERLSEPVDELRHPRLPRRAWSSRHGHYEPELAATTRERWTVRHMPNPGGVAALPKPREIEPPRQHQPLVEARDEELDDEPTQQEHDDEEYEYEEYVEEEEESARPKR